MLQKLFLLILMVGTLKAGQPEFDARLSGFSYPFTTHNFEFQSQRQQLAMAYMHLEATGGQPTFMLLHGKNFSGYYFEKVARLLHQQGFGVLIPDQIGFGKSSKPPHYQFSFPQLARNTHQLLQHLDLQNVIVLGHSMGGMLATRFALMYPDTSKGLWLINPIGLENYLDYVQYQDVDFFYKVENRKTAQSIRAYQRKNYYDGQWKPAYEKLIQTHIGWLNGPDRNRIAWNNALTYDMIFSQPVVGDFRKLQVPLTLILGTRDTTGPGRNFKREGVDYQLGRYDLLGTITAMRAPDTLLYELDGLGHMPFIEDFARFEKVFEMALVETGLRP